ncbi:uncharacterized protein EI90DRAFT_3063364 [Cantharellus anzutake]|uniref:uncharacterized protein n=1 Tax=Cantharellus anzutake TaxID=1750568 RepID=UPI001907AEBC|nr:uncharacterized protein EI90DRAFT_3063364 [Cantharellus anzutake]KAF8329158.1 hypothetical protein EI90DRAFT_3063364 [Cantharellus anzutake]
MPVQKRKSHGWNFFIFLLGTLLPPLAVAARFGFGRDFWINVPLTIAGYIPGHIHNFYIQNIRNNKTHARTPKWAIRYGLVDTTKIERNIKRSEWRHRYEQDPENRYENRPVDEGQIPDVPRDQDLGNRTPELWRPEDEEYHRQTQNPSTGSINTASQESASGRSGGRWHYPANFEDAYAAEPSPKKSKKKDRFARSEDAMTESRRKKKSGSSKSRKNTHGDDVSGGVQPVDSDQNERVVDPESLNHQF